MSRMELAMLLSWANWAWLIWPLSSSCCTMACGLRPCMRCLNWANCCIICMGFAPGMPIAQVGLFGVCVIGRSCCAPLSRRCIGLLNQFRLQSLDPLLKRSDVHGLFRLIRRDRKRGGCQISCAVRRAQPYDGRRGIHQQRGAVRRHGKRPCAVFAVDRPVRS